MVFTRPHMQFPNRTLLPKSPFRKGRLKISLTNFHSRSQAPAWERKLPPKLCLGT